MGRNRRILEGITYTFDMAKFNSACFLIAELLFILDHANAKGRGRGRGGGFSGYSDGEPGFSGFEIFLIVVVALVFLISIVYCCLQIANICDDDDEEKQEDPTQLESVHSVQHGQDKSSNDQPLGVPLFAPPPYPPQPAPGPDCWQVPANAEQVTSFGSRW